ncbi:MAG: L-fucose mutarotase [Spirochaetia bacterium]|jgi:L-fucose mutarotase|nr:L-fucose mutarotase [Spirochaetia bacterium]
MLKGISKYLSPELLYHLYKMGHGDELVIADAFYPGDTMNKLVIRADGIGVVDLLNGILPLFNLDSYVSNPVQMMAVPSNDTPDPEVEKSYRSVIDQYYPDTQPIGKIERFEFYERSKKAYAILMTGETTKYGNIIIKKGVITV